MPDVSSCTHMEPSKQFIPATMAAIKLLLPAPIGPSMQTNSPCLVDLIWNGSGLAYLVVWKLPF